MNRTIPTLAMALIVGIALSACGTAERATDSNSSHAPSDMTRDNKAKRPASG
jgi:hypothetical protein